MFLRVDRGHVAPGKLEAFASFMATDVTPQLRTLPGYRSTSVAVDRPTGKVIVTTDWDSPKDRGGCDEVLATVLRNGSRFDLRPIEIELLERVSTDAASNEVSPP